MELIRGIHNLRPRHLGSVVTIGNFDGVHRGHQVILAGLKAAGQQLGLPDTVMIFEPQPQEFFQGGQAPARLMNWRDKIDALAATGVARVLCVRSMKNSEVSPRASLSSNCWCRDWAAGIW